ncbi:OB-fold domain-containing protein [Mycobacterium sp. 236(2023)]|uniref:Zn-ribbon domain-containing OB-fold protein n=1 Tax=Mycobacterium sp. 236(2023) TaxID=3038163 RepID=UPI002414FEE3|nr:OB-fold domain-containing protein [Mycobacterium sp. 236(2023)]MDG4668091.1 OB-fold domain-containing protein [Mycobacterium sp. 236(2023)]
MTAPRAPRVDNDPLAHRQRPVQDPLSEFFWRSGADGVLRIQTCADCGYRTHPPGPVCARCLSAECTPLPVSGYATILTLTVNVQPWTPGLDPYVIALVGLDEQDDLRLTTNIVDGDPWSVNVGDRVRVTFLERHGFFYPLFARSS